MIIDSFSNGYVPSTYLDDKNSAKSNARDNPLISDAISKNSPDISYLSDKNIIQIKRDDSRPVTISKKDIDNYSRLFYKAVLGHLWVENEYWNKNQPFPSVEENEIWLKSTFQKWIFSRIGGDKVDFEAATLFYKFSMKEAVVSLAIYELSLLAGLENYFCPCKPVVMHKISQNNIYDGHLELYNDAQGMIREWLIPHRAFKGLQEDYKEKLTLLNNIIEPINICKAIILMSLADGADHFFHNTIICSTREGVTPVLIDYISAFAPNSIFLSQVEESLYSRRYRRGGLFCLPKTSEPISYKDAQKLSQLFDRMDFDAMLERVESIMLQDIESLDNPFGFNKVTKESIAKLKVRGEKMKKFIQHRLESSQTFCPYELTYAAFGVASIYEKENI